MLNIPNCTKTEREAIALIRQAFAARYPHLEMREVSGNDPTALSLQRHYGDLLWFHKDPAQHAGISFAEVKAESRFTGNLFIETWSNAAEEPARLNPGWAAKCEGHWLFYVFLDRRVLYMLPRHEVLTWFWKHHYKYPERTQEKHEQRNITRGVLVPIEDVEEMLTVKGKAFHVIPLCSTSAQNDTAERQVA